jgi:N4-gp56 family major capsid protein
LQFADVKDASQQGKSKGETFTWNIFSDVSTQGTTLTETVTMPETQFTIAQGTLTIVEKGNSVPYSGKLDDLSAQPIKEIINKVLKFDASKAFDIAAHYQFNQCALRVAPTSGTSTTALTLTTNGTCATTNTLAFQKEHAGLVSTLMKERNISPYIADDYYAIAWPSTFETLREDLEGIRMYTSEGYQEIKNGELGRYRNIRFVEQTQIPKGGAADSTTWNADTKTADAWNQAKSDWIFFMGNDTVAEGIAVAEEMRGKIPSDYGRSKGIAWYYLGGFGIVHTQASQTRILKWDSAA